MTLLPAEAQHPIWAAAHRDAISEEDDAQLVKPSQIKRASKTHLLPSEAHKPAAGSRRRRGSSDRGPQPLVFISTAWSEQDKHTKQHYDPPTGASSAQLASTHSCTCFSYSCLFSEKSCAARLFAGLLGFGSSSSDWMDARMPATLNVGLRRFCSTSRKMEPSA